MKDIPIIRIFRYALAVFVCLFFVANILSNEARAETGTINIQYTRASDNGTFAVAGASNADFTRLNFDIANYNSIDYLSVIMDTNNSLRLTSNSTFFTCVAPNSCSGGVSYNKYGKIIDWDFNTGAVITTSPIQLVYEENIFDSYNINLDPGYPDATGISTNLPVCLRITSGGCVATLKNTIPTTDIQNYTSVVMLNTNIGYNITYPLAGKYSGNITKSGTSLTKIIFEEAGGVIDFAETTFNNTSFEIPFLTYGNGLYINATMSNGAYTKALINSTNAGLPATPNNPDDNFINGIGLIWAFNTYTLDDIGNLTWNKTTPSLSCDVIRIYDPSNTEVYAIDNPSDIGFYKISLGVNGQWKAEYRRKICLIGQESVLNTAYTTVSPEQPSYIIASSPQASGIAFNATYSFGYTPQAQGELNSISIEKLNGDVWQQVNAVSLNNTAIVAGTEYNKSITLGDIGKYRLRLFELSRGYVAYVIVDSIFVEIPTQKNITTSIIEVDKYQYLTGDPISIYYAIDNTNYSNYQSKYISIIHASGSYPETSHIVITEQEDIINYVSGALQTAKQGLNYVRLRAKNNTADIIITNTSFNISFIDAAGYGLDVIDPTVCKGEQIIIKYSTPSTSTLRVNTISQDNLIVKYYEISINGSGSVSLKLTKATDYQILIYEGNLGNVRKFTTAKAETCAGAATPSATGGAAMQTQTDNFLSSGMFIVLIILLLFAGAGLHFGGFGGAVIGFGAGFIFCAIYNLVPLWSLFLFAILVITAFAVFMGDKITGGGSGG